MKTYWHFARIKDGVPIMRDGTPIEIGREYTTDRAKLCEVGYHGSDRIIDALSYTPGPWISKRVITGDIDQSGDKICGTRCVHVVGFDATEVLHKFARMCALDVIGLWDAPAVVVRYLKTGDNDIRYVAEAAARVAARAAEDGAGDAAGAAARAAARAASLTAARAARAAAEDAAWAAGIAAWDVAWEAGVAEDTAEAAARAARAEAEVAAQAAGTVAWEAAVKRQNRRLTRMVNRALKALEGDKRKGRERSKA